jgi:hypothetical protein
MPALPAKVKVFIIERLGAFEPPSAVATAVKEEFGLSVMRQVVEGHDPHKSTGRQLGKRWRELFEAKRVEFLASADRIGITHKVTRLQRLERHHPKMEAAGNIPVAAALLEQAAKEVGDVFTNRRSTEMTGAGGGTIEASHVFDFSALSDEDLAAVLAELSKPDAA